MPHVPRRHSSRGIKRSVLAPPQVFRMGCELAALTQGHPTGVLPAGVLAVLVLALIDGATLPDAVTTASACLRAVPDHEETLQAVRQAMNRCRNAFGGNILADKDRTGQ